MKILVYTACAALMLSAFHDGKGNDKHNLKAISTQKAPSAIGPYSQAVMVGKDIYCSGQIGLVPATGVLAGADINAQTTQALYNLKEVVEAAGSDMEHVAKVTVYLKNLDDYAAVNEIYKTYFPGTKPARAAVQVARLPKDALVEIEAVAIGRME